MPEKVSLEIGTESADSGSIEKLKAESKAAAQDTVLMMDRRPRVELCLDECIEWIKKQTLEDYIERGLIRAASRCPHSALTYFMQTIQQEITRIVKSRKKKYGKKESSPKKQSPKPKEEVRKSVPAFSSAEFPEDFGAPVD
jgi:hypothetical protein